MNIRDWLHQIAILFGCCGLVGDNCLAQPTLEKATGAAELCARVSPMPKTRTYQLPREQVTMRSAEFTQPSQSVLCMSGSFWFETRQKIQELRNLPLVEILVIDSGGGWTEPAISLAKLAERHNWLIVVKDKCFSSCATIYSCL